jgi:hypothetical protein
MHLSFGWLILQLKSYFGWLGCLYSISLFFPRHTFNTREHSRSLCFLNSFIFNTNLTVCITMVGMWFWFYSLQNGSSEQYNVDIGRLCHELL